MSADKKEINIPTGRIDLGDLVVQFPKGIVSSKGTYWLTSKL
ncbi:hypothetical protein [Pedobacter sp. MW01-1-1]